MNSRTRNAQGLLAVAVAVWVSVAATGRATPIFEPNNSVAKSTILTAGQFKVIDSLLGNVGRPDTLLGSFDPTFTTLQALDDNSSPLGNGKASQLLNVPFRPNGSAYFSITGAPDSLFSQLHPQSGQYSVLIEFFDSSKLHFDTRPLIIDTIEPNSLDLIFINPDPDPRRIGGTINVTINNVVGPGTGDSLDFFLFSGLAPNQPFTAVISQAEFPALIAQWSPTSQILAMSDPADSLGSFVGQANAFGQAIIGVSGRGDSGFKGAHAEGGSYTLELVSVPEPSTALLGALGGLALIGLARRRG